MIERFIFYNFYTRAENFTLDTDDLHADLQMFLCIFVTV